MRGYDYLNNDTPLMCVGVHRAGNNNSSILLQNRLFFVKNTGNTLSYLFLRNKTKTDADIWPRAIRFRSLKSIG